MVGSTDIKPWLPCMPCHAPPGLLQAELTLLQQHREVDKILQQLVSSSDGRITRDNVSEQLMQSLHALNMIGLCLLPPGRNDRWRDDVSNITLNTRESAHGVSGLWLCERHARCHQHCCLLLLMVVQVIAVERVQNPALWRRYVARREDIRAESGDADLNERLLFHGTSCSECICERVQCGLSRWPLQFCTVCTTSR